MFTELDRVNSIVSINLKNYEEKKFNQSFTNMARNDFIFFNLLFDLYSENFFNDLFLKYTEKVFQGFPKIKLFKKIGLQNISKGEDLFVLRKYFILLGFVPLDMADIDIDNVQNLSLIHI